MSYAQCQWVKDGWPSRQCEKDGIEVVYSATNTFPTARFCKRHAEIMRKREKGTK